MQIKETLLAIGLAAFVITLIPLALSLTATEESDPSASFPKKAMESTSARLDEANRGYQPQIPDDDWRNRIIGEDIKEYYGQNENPLLLAARDRNTEAFRSILFREPGIPPTPTLDTISLKEEILGLRALRDYRQGDYSAAGELRDFSPHKAAEMISVIAPGPDFPHSAEWMDIFEDLLQKVRTEWPTEINEPDWSPLVEVFN